MDRRTFIKLGAGATALAMMPLSACTTDTIAAHSLEPEVTVGPVAYGARGVRFEVQPERHRLVITHRSGQQHVISRVGAGIGELNYPMRVATHRGLAYVVECGNHRVQVFDADGRSVGMLGVDELEYPKGITIVGEEIYVADSRNKRIAVFDIGEDYVARTFGADVLQAPYAVAVVDGRLIVADAGLRQVVELGRDGRIVEVLAGDFVLPYDVAWDGEVLAVADAAHAQVSLFDRHGRPSRVIALAKAPTFCAIDDGRLFVG